MNVDPLRDNRADPILRVKVVRRPFAAFRCLDTTCTHLFAGDIPAIFEDLPSCPICECDSQIECLLVCEHYDDKHHHRRYPQNFG